MKLELGRKAILVGLRPFRRLSLHIGIILPSSYNIINK